MYNTNKVSSYDFSIYKRDLPRRYGKSLQDIKISATNH